MKPNVRVVIEMCIERGITYGYQRAHKHTTSPSFNQISEAIEAAIWEQLYEYFVFANSERENNLQ
jgi:hypothetical protein